MLQRQYPASPTAQSPLAIVNSDYSGTMQVFAGLCAMADARKSLKVHASRKQIAAAAGIRSKSLKGISRALGELHRGGLITLSSIRIRRDDNQVVELLTICLIPGSNPMLPMAPLSDRIGHRFRTNIEQQSLTELCATNPRAFPTWAALCQKASAQGSLTVTADNSQLAAIAGTCDSRGERTGRAIRSLEKAGWVVVERRSGRRGNKVKLGRYRLILGPATRQFSPISALIQIGRDRARKWKDAVVRRAKIRAIQSRIPTPPNSTHEPLRGTNSLTATEEKKNNQPAAACGVVRPFLSSNILTTACARLSIPTSQVEMMRPRILDAEIGTLFSTPGDMASVDRRLEGIAELMPDLQSRIDLVKGLTDPRHGDYALYKKAPKRWKDYQNCLVDWQQEATEIEAVVSLIRDCLLADPLDQAKKRSLERRRRKLAHRLQSRKANRRNRRLFYSGPDLVRSAMDMVGKPVQFARRYGAAETSFAPISQPPIPGYRRSPPMTSHCPRFYEIASNYLYDTLRDSCGMAKEPYINATLRPLPPGWWMTHGPRDPEEARLFRYDYRMLQALRPLANLSKRAVDTVTAMLDTEFQMWRGDEDYRIWGFLNQLRTVGCGPNPLHLIAGRTAVDGADLGNNLRPHTHLRRVYAEARREYADAPALGMVVRVGRRLWVIHDDQQVGALPGTTGFVTAGLEPSRDLYFEPFESFILAANQIYRWGRVRTPEEVQECVASRRQGFTIQDEDEPDPMLQ